ncbi:hypothetical protein BRPE64_ACDS07520 [Caballeronia insecticola]|uniref:Uncharacterized protein n=1 Tax=Caballeronia insecticola TaxID=758793 RepID=R4WUC7_9BURK|nr:hypothetical protein BRPE64_ACDS07520 [Caballeronia insecticola]
MKPSLRRPVRYGAPGALESALGVARVWPPDVESALSHFWREARPCGGSRCLRLRRSCTARATPPWDWR